MHELQRAKALLREKTTCVVVCGDEVLQSEKTGIAPMLGWISEGKNLRGAAVADRIVGKAAAMLFVLAEVRTVYAEVLSHAGYCFLLEHGVAVAYDKKVSYIINRTGTGPCPMEAAVLEVEDATRGYEILLAKAKALQARS